MKTRLVVVVCLLCVLCGPALAQDARELLEQGNALADRGDPAGALVLYRKALELEPDKPVLLYNAGMAAYLTGQFVESAQLFKRYRVAQPDDWRGLTKLIQAYQAAGDSSSADAAVVELRTWRKAGTSADLTRQKAFVRDQFVIDGDRVFVFERFVQGDGDLQRIWEFVLVGSDNKPKRVYYVEFDRASTRMAREQGNKDVELHFFDMDDPSGHTTFGQIDHRPTYAEAAERMKTIISGKVKPAARTTPGR